MNPAQNQLTPDQVPVENPINIPIAPKKSDYSTTLMIAGIIIFVFVIFIEAYFLVQKVTSTESKATEGPTLQQ